MPPPSRRPRPLRPDDLGGGDRRCPRSSPDEGSAPTTTGAVDSTDADTTTSTVHERDDGVATLPVATFPEADPEAQNFLITGADNGACIDPDSPYAGAFGDREGMGERSDTIMVLRVDPDADRVAAAVVPPRSLRRHRRLAAESRINSAYRRNEPQRLIDTIYENFGVPIDHYIQVDFCAFKTLVDAVGGVAVPFEFPARDDNTGLNVPTTGCFVFDGEHALAYVRSRHYQYEDPPGSGNWQEDPSSDLGRVSRQQDFIRRTLSSILDEGPLNPRVARGLIRAATEYVVTDRDLTAARMLEFAGVMNDVDPASILTYQIEATRADDQRGRRCSSRTPTARTCRRSWPCSAARRHWPTPRRKCSKRPARLRRAGRRRRWPRSAAPSADRVDRRRPPMADCPRRPMDIAVRRRSPARRPAGEPGRHRPAPRRHLLSRSTSGRD